MKKLLLVITLLAATTAAQAQWHHNHRHWNGRTVIVERNDWVAPLIIGGIAGAVIANANQPQQPVIVQQNPNCSPWTETQNPDGTITRTRTCNQ